MPLIPLHPEAVAGDDRTLRWICPPATLDFVGTPAAVPTSLQELLDDGTLDDIEVEPAAVRLRLGTGRLWRESGGAVRAALQTALGSPGQWTPASDASTGDDVLRLAVQQVIDGEVGAYIRSHGGVVEVLSVHDDAVEVRLRGACSHCPASDITLTERLEGGIRALHPALRQLSARSDPGLGAGRRMLNLMPTRHR